MTEKLKVLMNQDKARKDWIIGQLDGFDRALFYEQMKVLQISRLMDDKMIEQYIRSLFQSEFFQTSQFTIEFDGFKAMALIFKGVAHSVRIELNEKRNIIISAQDEPPVSMPMPDELLKERQLVDTLERLSDETHGKLNFREIATVISDANVCHFAEDVAMQLRKTGTKKHKLKITLDYIHDIESKIEVSDKNLLNWHAWHQQRLLFEGSGEFFLEEIRSDLAKLVHSGGTEPIVQWSNNWYQESKLQQELQRVTTDLQKVQAQTTRLGRLRA